MRTFFEHNKTTSLSNGEISQRKHYKGTQKFITRNEGLKTQCRHLAGEMKSDELSTSSNLRLVP